MSSAGGFAPLTYRRLAPSESGQILRLDFDPEQLERFLGPLPEVIDAVRRGPAHHLVGIEEEGGLVGFYALHPDRRHGACWWLGWFGIDRAHQGGGRGGRVLAAILARLGRDPACREVRLLVSPDNAPALRLYRRAGFVVRGVWRHTGELVMRYVLPPRRPASDGLARGWARSWVQGWVQAILRQVIEARACRMGVPVAAQLHGEVAFPP